MMSSKAAFLFSWMKRGRPMYFAFGEICLRLRIAWIEEMDSGLVFLLNEIVDLKGLLD